MAIDQTTALRISVLEKLLGIVKGEIVLISKSFDTNQNLQYDSQTQFFTLTATEPLSIGTKILLLEEAILGFNGIYSIINEATPLTYQLTREVKSTDLENTIVNLGSVLYKVIKDKDEGQPINFFLSKVLDYADLVESVALKEDQANKGVADGYASLDNLGKVPFSQLPEIAGAGGEFVPIGAVQNYYGSIAPAGFLFLNRETYTKSNYQELWNFAVANRVVTTDISKTGLFYHESENSTTFRVPDSKGYFFRGLGGVDPDASTRTVGSIQQDEFKSHSHTLPVDQSGTNDMPHMNNSGGTDEGFLQTSKTELTGGLETRPKNIAVNHIIKAKHNPSTAYNLVAGTGISITTNEVDKTATISGSGGSTPAASSFIFRERISGVNWTINAGSNSFFNFTDEFATQGVVDQDTNFLTGANPYFIYDSTAQALKMRTNIVNEHIEFLISCRVSYNGGSGSEFAFVLARPTVSSNTSTGIIETSIRTQGQNVQSTQTRSNGLNINTRLLRTSAGTDPFQTEGFKLGFFNYSTSTAITITDATLTIVMLNRIKF